MTQRAAGVVIVGGSLVLLSWVLAPAAPDRSFLPATPQAVAASDRAAAAVTPASAEVQQQAGRLAARLETPPPAGHPQRNPFEWGRRPTRPARAASPAPALRPGAEADPPAAPPQLPVVVALLAKGDARTAVLSWNDELMTVKAGDSVGRFVVRAIGADAVTVEDVATHQISTLGVR